MKIKVITLAFLCTALCCFGQETKKVKVKNENPPYTETYLVLKSDPTIRHGAYERNYDGPRGGKDVGQYSNGKKTGIWEFYWMNDLQQRIDVAAEKVLFEKEKNMVESAVVLENGKPGETTSENLPILLGGAAKCRYIIQRSTRYPAPARRFGVQGTAAVSATITEAGKLIDVRPESSLGYELEQEAVRVINLLAKEEWIPLKVNGKAVDSQIMLHVNFRLAE